MRRGGLNIADIVLNPVNNRYNSLLALNSNGTLKWTFVGSSDDVIGTPSISHKNIVYVIRFSNGGHRPFDNGVYAIDNNGKLLWTFAPSGFDVPGGDRSVVAIGLDDTVYVQGYSPPYTYLAAIGSSGEQKWLSSYNSIPAIDTYGNLYSIYSAYASSLFRLSPIDGSAFYIGLIDYDDFPTLPSIGLNGDIYVIDEHIFKALSPDGKKTWQYIHQGTFAHQPGEATTAVDGTIYFWSYDYSQWIGRLHALNPDGSVRWVYDFPPGGVYPMGSPAIGNDGTIYVAASSGVMAFNPDGVMLWGLTDIQINSVLYNSPILGADGTLYILGYDKTSGNAYLYAINTSSTGPANSSWPMMGADAQHTRVVRGIANTANFTCPQPAPNTGVTYTGCFAIRNATGYYGVLWFTDSATSHGHSLANNTPLYVDDTGQVSLEDPSGNGQVYYQFACDSTYHNCQVNGAYNPSYFNGVFINTGTTQNPAWVLNNTAGGYASYNSTRNIVDPSGKVVYSLTFLLLSTPEQPMYGAPPPPVTKPTHIVFLIHGWNSAPSCWADKMKESIKEKLPNYTGQEGCNVPIEDASTSWQVCTYDWSQGAEFSGSCWLPNLDFINSGPWTAYVNAIEVGKRLAKVIVDGQHNYDFIHFIAHSAGSQVADTAATWLPILIDKHNKDNPATLLTKPIIHTTFLDAYDPRGVSSLYGASSQWAEQYVDSRHVGPLGLEDFTNITLQNAYNFDVTSLDPNLNLPGPLGMNAHEWPYKWYQSTVDDNIINNYGFGLSLEDGINQFPNPGNWQQVRNASFPKGGKCFLVSNTECSEGAPPAKLGGFKVIAEDLLTLLIDTVSTSFTGSVVFDQVVSDWVLKLVTGSPVWVSLPVKIVEPIDTLTFKYSFPRQAEGLLSVFFDDQLVFRADERIEQPGVNYSDYVPVGARGSGTHTLSFRLDAFNGTQSEIDISNIQLGKMETSNNQPPVANAGLGQTVRQGSLVTLNGSASSDPDQGPSPLSFAWKQTAGPPATLTNANSVKPTFTPLVQGSYIFSLVVNDGQDDSVSASVAITISTLGDIDLDGDVDNDDLNLILAARNTQANGPNDLRDLDGDGTITVLDARKLVLLCTRPKCATH